MFVLGYVKSNSSPQPPVELAFRLSNSLDIINGDYYNMGINADQALEQGIIASDTYENMNINTDIYTNDKGCYIFITEMNTFIAPSGAGFDNFFIRSDAGTMTLDQFNSQPGDWIKSDDTIPIPIYESLDGNYHP